MIDFGHGVYLDAILGTEVELLRTWRNDPRIWRWTRQNDVITEVHQKTWWESLPNDKTVQMYAVRAQVAGLQRIVGVCGLTSIDWRNRRAEFSLYIAPNFQKGGLGKKALATLLDHAFKNMNLNCVWGESFDGNPAFEMFKSLGFYLEGVLRQRYYKSSKWIDTKIFSILKDEWK